MSLLNSSCVEELSENVEKLTHTGQKTLDPLLMKKLKDLCRLSDKYVEHVYHLITHQLNKEHAEIRYSAFQICDELFRRSHCFRELVITDLRHIMNMTAETSPKHPLPLPRSAALDLKQLALKTMQQWNNEFGPAYKKLQIGFNFLQACKKVDFNALHNESLAEQARNEERERRQNIVNEDRLRKVNMEIDEMEPEIKNSITALDTCITLLLPTPEDFFIANNENDDDTRCFEGVNQPSTSQETQNKYSEDSSSESESKSINLREYGLVNHNQTIQVTINTKIGKIKETLANKAIIENAQDLFKQLDGRYCQQVKKWITILTKSSAASDLLKKIIDLKQLLVSVIDKFNQLQLIKHSNDDTSDSDSDFEEVEEKEGYEETVKEDILSSMINARASNSLIGYIVKESKPAWSIWSHENNSKDPTTPQCTITTLPSTKSPNKIHATSSSNEPLPSTSTDSSSHRKTKLLAVAPKLPFDIDLYHWEDENVPVPTMVAVFAEGSQFWSARPAEGMEEIPVPDGSASLRTRVIEYSGEFQPVKWSCRAPLDSGKLCPRKDRLKCPFHGPIVPRDATGQCSKPEDAERFQRSAEEEKIITPDWQDPKLLEELKAATGVDLKMPEKRKRGKKSKKKVLVKYPGLTDIKAKLNTPHSRLSKKVFKKSTMKRISASLDTMDHKRFRDKYGDQFHYMYNTA